MVHDVLVVECSQSFFFIMIAQIERPSWFQSVSRYLGNIPLIHSTRNLCSRFRIDGIEAISRGVSRGKQVMKFAMRVISIPFNFYFLFSALPLSGWNVTVLMSSYFGFSIQWSSLRTNIDRNARFYLIVINSPEGNLLAVETVPGSATTEDITGLRPSTRYRIGVYGIDETGQAYKSSESVVSTNYGKVHI